MLLAYVLLRLPGFQWLGLGAAALPNVLAWRSDRRRKLEAYVDEQREIAEVQYDEINARLAELTAIHEIGVALSTTLNVQELIDKSLRSAGRRSRPRAGWWPACRWFGGDGSCRRRVACPGG